MHRTAGLIAVAAAMLLSPGCVARAVVDVATLPVKATSKAVDLATTSQSEADEKRGREMRKREERLAKLQRKYDKLLAKCQGGDHYACTDAQSVEGQIRDLAATLPPKPD